MKTKNYQQRETKTNQGASLLSLFLFSWWMPLLGLSLSQLKRHWGLVHPRTVPYSLTFSLRGGKRGAAGIAEKLLGEQVDRTWRVFFSKERRG